METKKMGELYVDIANKVNEIIPDKWEKIWLYAEVLDDSSEVYFYFYSKISKKIIYSHDIPNKYKVNNGIYEDLLFELLDIIQELNSEYKQNNESVWTNLTFLLDNTGKFKIKYNYDDVLKSEFTSGERQIIWEYEVLGVEPELKEYKEMINKYLESKNNLQ
ncbi:MAG: antitoxin YezG family protein [Clostridium sp.]|jgi:hypothetical protein|uniref:antitoxin YezG family protein n=1 Tax=Clostridium sp. TaxID=1506 RepID=UPI0025C29A57|nr:antitoxin YezG family protein [Clostridium sp.]MCI6693247.1 antitoxin YezG family protein [Clostridium sp.]MDY2631896.1 antitoxin YezG family protein [Clostridium sp.]MDY4252981.1 antitoxin YezG family protein [Clostridium sp.]MDY6229041.1 antitoxin YezG family protein [Clostridium sp.]